MEGAYGQAMGTTEGALWCGPSFNPRDGEARPRDVKPVHSDLTALLHAGVLDRVEDGRIIFPFDAVKVEFLLRIA